MRHPYTQSSCHATASSRTLRPRPTAPFGTRRLMSLSLPRGGRWASAVTILAVLSVVGSRSAFAEVAAPSDGVFVSGVRDTFDTVREAIERARKASGRDYRVVIVDSAREAGDARRLLDRITDRWRDETAGEAGGFDPSRDIAILLDLGGRQLAMKVPHGLEVASGLDTAAVERELIAKAFVPRAKDGLYADGLASLVDASENLVRDRAEAARRRVEAARVFRTRTLPIGLASLATAGLLGTLAVQRVRSRRRLWEAREKLASFKSDVVALSEMLDEQQERHRMLPHADPDFVTPMEGQTRTAYDNVQTAIRRYRERWLGLMDVWEKAQSHVDREWWLGTTEAEEALRLLDAAEARPPLEDVAGECRAPLDALETAHEKARALVTSFDADMAATEARLARLADRGRSGGGLQAAVADVARGRSLAAAEVESDPVAARGRLEDAAAGLAAVTARVEAIEAADDRRCRVLEQTESVESQVRSRRAEGWRLDEEGANPDELLGLARHEASLAAQLLDAAEPEAATGHLERAERAAAEALALLESIVAARTRVEELLPMCAARLEALAGRREAVVRSLEHLAAGYAESSWSDVAENLSRADEGLSHVHALVASARDAAEPSRQHYFRALALLEEAVRQEDWVEGCQAAIGERRAELDELRASLPGRRDTVQDRVVKLGRRLERQQTDRARANERCREAIRLVEVASNGIATARPDLRVASQLVDAADAAAARGEQFAEEDDRLARQAASDLDEADALIRRVGAWYAEGVQADVRGAAGMVDSARSLLRRQRYEEAIASAGEASRAARSAYAAATAEAERRRIRRQQELQRRRMAESFERMSRGAGPWMIDLPGGTFTGPDPWRSLQSGLRRSAAPSRTAGGGWSRDIAQVGW